MPAVISNSITNRSRQDSTQFFELTHAKATCVWRKNRQTPYLNQQIVPNNGGNPMFKVSRCAFALLGPFMLVAGFAFMIDSIHASVRAGFYGYAAIAG